MAKGEQEIIYPFQNLLMGMDGGFWLLLLTSSGLGDGWCWSGKDRSHAHVAAVKKRPKGPRKLDTRDRRPDVDVEVDSNSRVSLFHFFRCVCVRKVQLWRIPVEEQQVKKLNGASFLFTFQSQKDVQR